MASKENNSIDVSLSKDFKELFNSNDKEIVEKLVKKYNLSEQTLVSKLIDLELV